MSITTNKRTIIDLSTDDETTPSSKRHEVVVLDDEEEDEEDEEEQEGEGEEEDEEETEGEGEGEEDDDEEEEEEEEEGELEREFGKWYDESYNHFVENLENSITLEEIKQLVNKAQERAAYFAAKYSDSLEDKTLPGLLFVNDVLRLLRENLTRLDGFEDMEYDEMLKIYKNAFHVIAEILDSGIHNPESCEWDVGGFEFSTASEEEKFDYVYDRLTDE